MDPWKSNQLAQSGSPRVPEFLCVSAVFSSPSAPTSSDACNVSSLRTYHPPRPHARAAALLFSNQTHSPSGSSVSMPCRSSTPSFRCQQCLTQSKRVLSPTSCPWLVVTTAILLQCDDISQHPAIVPCHCSQRVQVFSLALQLCDRCVSSRCTAEEAAGNHAETRTAITESWEFRARLRIGSKSGDQHIDAMSKTL